MDGTEMQKSPQMPIVPKQQHWVPRVYLKQFGTSDSLSGNDPKVWVWDKTTGRSPATPVRVDTICSNRYLYTPQLTTGVRDPSMEDELGNAETLAGKFWPEILLSRNVLSDTIVRDFLADFIALLHLRNLWLFSKMNKGVELARKLYGTPESLNRDGVDGTDPANFAKGAFVKTIRGSLERVKEALRRKRWLIMHYDFEAVMTSDRPVLFCTQRTLCNGPFQKDTKIFFPLSPRHILYMDDHATLAGNIDLDGPPEAPMLVNTLLESHALRILVGPKPIQEFRSKNGIMA